MSENPLRIGVIGFGYWGPNLVRNFASLERSTVTAVADLDESKLRQMQKIHPATRATRNASELIASDDVDAVAIATPVASHFQLAEEALLAGKHVLIEKPLARTSDQARSLMELADRQQRVLFVDHTFVYTGAVRAMRSLIQQGELGELYYFDSARINLGLLQPDVNVLWDLATHDLSILLYLVEQSPASVRAIGHSYIAAEREETAFLHLQYASGFHAHIRVSWLSPVKMRLTLVGGANKMIVYDDVEPSDKVRVYDRGVAWDMSGEEVTTSKPIYRAGDVLIPKLDRSEALRVEAEHFLDCIEHGERPITGGPEGLAVVRLLEAAEKSLKSGGEPVGCEWRK
jgi:predicted dehydrogenase